MNKLFFSPEKFTFRIFAKMFASKFRDHAKTKILVSTLATGVFATGGGPRIANHVLFPVVVFFHEINGAARNNGRH
jgi:hypothetical protein